MIDLTTCRRVLAFFAHPDDETLAAGGTIARLTEMGADVVAAIPGQGPSSRDGQECDGIAEDLDTVAEELKIRRVVWGFFADNAMDVGGRLALIKWLENVIEDFRPDLILTHHHADLNVDHRYCYEAVAVAARPTEDWRPTVLCGEIPGSTGVLMPAAWQPNVYVGLSADDLNRKVAAMECYRTERREAPHPRSPESLRALATVRGTECGHHLAEAFMLHRGYV